MSQHDGNIANQNFPTFRSDLNDALAAILTNSSGATAPGTTVPYQWWYDTSTDSLKMRNADNDAWITIGTFDQVADNFISIVGLTVSATELNYTSGVSSNIQTQLNAKQAADADLTTLAGLAKTDGNFIVGNGTAWVAESGSTARASLGLPTASSAEMTAASPTSSLRAMSPALVKVAIDEFGAAGYTPTAPDMKVYTSVGNNTWTKPSGLIGVRVTVIGGGGGGGRAGMGGAGGGTAIEYIPASSLGGTVTATVGGGGSGGTISGTSGGHGGTSSFEGFLSATGGDGGQGNTNYALETGGVGSGGDINIQGGYNNQSHGGDSVLGFGTASNPSGTAPTGRGYGAGGGGGVDSQNGGAGSSGVVIVEEFF